MSKLKMNCGYCGRKCDLDKDFCIPQDSVYVCKSCYEWQKRVASLEEQLSNAIVPKFKIGQEVYVIIQDAIRTTAINSFRVFANNELSYYCKYVDGERMYLELDESDIFATKEEAQARDGILETEKDKQIADLEEKLAESEKQCRECKHLNKKIELNIKNKLMSENRQLQQELEEKDNTITNLIEDSKASKELLKKQLTDKDKEIEKLKEVVDTVDKLKQFNLDIKEYALINKNAVDEIYCEYQDKISFAVEQLRIAQKYIQKYVNNFDDMNDCLCTIDNQIKQLKEKDNG